MERLLSKRLDDDVRVRWPPDWFWRTFMFPCGPRDEETRLWRVCMADKTSVYFNVCWENLFFSCTKFFGCIACNLTGYPFTNGSQLHVPCPVAIFMLFSSFLKKPFVTLCPLFSPVFSTMRILWEVWYKRHESQINNNKNTTECLYFVVSHKIHELQKSTTRSFFSHDHDDGSV